MKKIILFAFILISCLFMTSCSNENKEELERKSRDLYQQLYESNIVDESYDEWYESIVNSSKSIADIYLSESLELVDTYTIVFTDYTILTYKVHHGVGIKNIEKTSTEGLVDTYTITYTDNSTTTFKVTNGKDGIDGKTGEQGPTGETGIQGIQGEPGKDGHTPVITIGENGNWFIDGEDSKQPSNIKGDTGNGISSIEITASEGLVDTYTITFTDGKTTSFNVTNGKDGKDGTDGRNGKSTYEIYCEKNPEYNKSESEWISELMEMINGKKHTVTFDPNNGEQTFTQTVNHLSYAVKPENIPVKGSSMFMFWADQYGEKWNFGGNLIAEDITLCAVYINYYINIEINSGPEFDNDVIYGTTLNNYYDYCVGLQQMKYYVGEIYGSKELIGFTVNGKMVDLDHFYTEVDTVFVCVWKDAFKCAVTLDKGDKFNNETETFDVLGESERREFRYELTKYIGKRIGNYVCTGFSIDGNQVDLLNYYLDGDVTFDFDWIPYDPSFEVSSNGYDGSDITINILSMGTYKINDYIEEFKKIYPNINVNLVTGSVESDNFFYSVIQSNQYDCLIGYGDSIAYLLNYDKALPLDGFMNSKLSDGNGGIIGFADNQKNDFVTSFLTDCNTFGDGYYYMLPLAKSTDLLYYNKTFFDNNQLSVPTHWISSNDSDTTSMEYVLKQIKLIDNDSIPLSIDDAANIFVELIKDYGSEYTSLDADDHIKFDNLNASNALYNLSDYVKQNYINIHGIGGCYSYSSYYLNNSYSYMAIGSSAGSRFYSEDLETGVSALPLTNSFLQGPNIGLIRTDDKNKQTATWLFIKYLLTNTDYQTDIATSSGYAPVINSAYETSEMKSFMLDGSLSSKAIRLMLDNESQLYSSPCFFGSDVIRQRIQSMVDYCISKTYDQNQTDLFMLSYIQSLKDADGNKLNNIDQKLIDASLEFVKLFDGCDNSEIGYDLEDSFTLPAYIIVDDIKYGIKYSYVYNLYFDKPFNDFVLSQDESVYESSVSSTLYEKENVCIKVIFYEFDNPEMNYYSKSLYFNAIPSN